MDGESANWYELVYRGVNVRESDDRRHVYLLHRRDGEAYSIKTMTNISFPAYQKKPPHSQSKTNAIRPYQ